MDLAYVVAFLGGLHYWWPKITGRMYPEWWARLSALLVFVGFNLTFFPQFIVGYVGMPRRYHAYAPEFQVLNVLSTAGATVLAVGYLLPMIYLIWSLFYGRKAGSNPWGAVAGRALIGLGLMEPPGPDTPGPFRLGDPERLRALVVGAGFEAFLPYWDSLSVEGSVGLNFSSSQTKTDGGTQAAQSGSSLGISGSGFNPLNVAIHLYF